MVAMICCVMETEGGFSGETHGDAVTLSLNGRRGQSGTGRIWGAKVDGTARRGICKVNILSIQLKRITT